MKNFVIFISFLMLISCNSAINTVQTTQTMNLKALHTQNKSVETALVFTSIENKVIALQIKKGEQLKEHITKVPAFLICVEGSAVYGDEKGNNIVLKPSEYIFIEANVKHWVTAKNNSNFLLIK